MKKILVIIFCFSTNFLVHSQNKPIKVPENLVTENIPEINSSIISDVKSYTESRGASFVAWHPTKKEMIISTRFANSNQLHYIKMPGGDRQQITFFEEPVSSANFEPVSGDYFLFGKDNGGNEFSQVYKFETKNKKVNQLSVGKRTQNSIGIWNTKKDKIAYTSTRRNGADRDFFIMNPLDTNTNMLVGENLGGGWAIADWSPSDESLLIGEGISINESRIYLLDLKTKTKTLLLPLKDERTTYEALKFSKDGKGFFLLTNKDSEFNRLAYFNFQSKTLEILSSTIKWGIEDVDISEDGTVIVFSANENGLSKIYIYSVLDKSVNYLSNIPNCTIGGLSWYKDSKSFAFTINSFNSSSDVFEYNLETKSLLRWTESELGGMDVSQLQEPMLIKWNAYDGKEISGFYYKAATKFTGKRPVIINIHGGPEGQSRPGFLGRSNYYLNELGVSIIYPNVRGSEGFGKTFLDADNGFKREESVKDIGALLDWIASQPDLDKDRVMIMGGSYGGYMTLACSFWYADKIRCSIDVVGISNFNTFLKNTESYRRDLRRVEYGDERDPKMYEFLEKISPLNHTKEIKKPLFIVQGENDPRVPASEAIQMKDKIKENGGTVWFLMAKDEGHGFKKKGNIDFQFYSTLEFMKKYLLN
jgi:dipeptidyl aminopeptidase/acylaminoacyl peptidase